MATQDTLSGTLFAGRYRISRKLGGGGMADVYLAEDQELGRRVAVKMLHGRYANDEQFVERFRREATHAAGLSHPNIVSIFDRGEADGSYFIVMEYVEGRTLKELIRSRGPCPVPVAIAYTRQILGYFGSELGRSHGHLGEVLHRDLDRAVACERHFTGKKLEEHDPGGVEVGGLVDRRAACLLGRQVLRRADDRPFLGHLTRPGTRDPEVGDLDHALGVDDDVVRLDVPMDHSVAVRVPQSGQYLARVGNRDGNRARAARADQLLQRPSLDVLHDDEVRAIGLAAVEDRDDVRMREPRGVRRLAAEALDELLVVRVAPVQHLDRDATAQLLVLCEVDVGHAAAAELA